MNKLMKIICFPIIILLVAYKYLVKNIGGNNEEKYDRKKEKIDFIKYIASLIVALLICLTIIIAIDSLLTN